MLFVESSHPVRTIFATKIVERGHVALVVEEMFVLSVRYDDCIRWKY
jgi:hypothetical protein